MSWHKISIAAAIIIVALGMVTIDRAIAEDFQVSGTWIMTNKWSDFGCEDHRWADMLRRDKEFKKRVTVEIFQEGTRITLAQFVYADYGDARIRNDLLRGDYDRNDIFFLAFNANWKF